MPRFVPEMLIQEALLAHPDAATVFQRHGLACPSCIAADIETISSVSESHDISVAELIDALNALPATEEEGTA